MCLKCERTQAHSLEAGEGKKRTYVVTHATSRCHRLTRGSGPVAGGSAVALTGTTYWTATVYDIPYAPRSGRSAMTRTPALGALIF
jgi:hypothetical protein